MIDIKADPPWEPGLNVIEADGSVKPWKITKIDKLIRDAIEITIICTKNEHDESGAIVQSGNVMLGIRYLSDIHGVHQACRLLEKLTCSARRLKIDRSDAFGVSFTTAGGSNITLSHTVFTPEHLWRQLVLPVCDLNPDRFHSSSEIIVPSYEMHMSRANPENA